MDAPRTSIRPELVEGRLLNLPDAAIAYIPAIARPHPPLLVLLHGPDSQGITWDSVVIAEEPPSPPSPLGHGVAHRFGRSHDAAQVEGLLG